jgi:hypothetical protein
VILTQEIPIRRAIKKYTAFGKADGAAGALDLPPNFPSLVVPYGAYRPPWNLAGVDYYVGHNPNLQLKDWRFLTNPDLSVTISAGQVFCSAATSLVEGVDFTMGTGAVLRNPSGGSTAFTVRNCKFAAPIPDASQLQAAGALIVDVNHANLTVTNNTFIGTDNTPRNMGCDDLATFIEVEGSLTAKYNLFYHPNQSVITMGLIAALPAYGLTYQYNCIYNHYLTSTSHRNEVQWSFGPSTSLQAIEVSYNTTFQDYHSTVYGDCTFTVAAPAVFTWQGTAGNPFVNGMPCILTGTIPGGFAAVTRYWVVNSVGNTFNLSSTFNGPGITSTGSPGTTTVSLTYFGHGEGFQFNFAVNPVAFNNTNFRNNILIARRVFQVLNVGSPDNTGVSAWVHGDAANPPSNSFNTQNYFDPTGADFIYYPGSMAGWTSSGNLDMTTNKIIVPA